MSALEFPRRHLGLLQELAVRLLGSRKPRTDHANLARELLVGFHDMCLRWGLDGLLTALNSEGGALADNAELSTAVVARLRDTDLDGGGPRNAKPMMLVDSLLAGLGVTLSDEPSREIGLADAVRVDVAAALASVIDGALALPGFRDRIIQTARKRCEPNHLHSFEIIAQQLDDRGMRLNRTPKVPVDSLHAVQRLLNDSRNAIIEQATRTAIDRAKDVLGRVSDEAANRIDVPVSGKLTPRDVAVVRACDSGVANKAPAVVTAVLDGLTDVIPIAWRAAEKIARPYGASQSFAVGDVIEHPKFGRGTVISVDKKRMDVEFADTKYTLVHAG